MRQPEPLATSVPAASPTPARPVAFGALLALTMAASTFAFTAFPVLSSPLLEAFGISRWQLGALVTATAVAGAVLSPLLGRVSDRIGGRSALRLTLALSALALAAIAVSPVYVVVVTAALAAGSAQSLSNPATNKLISLHVDVGARGTVTGVKQAGVQLGTFLGGALLPIGALTIGWRRALLLAALVPLLGLVVARRVVPGDPADAATAVPPSATLVRSAFLRRLACYGFLIGAGWSAVFTYLPDYAQQVLGFSVAVSGLVVAVAGAVGVAGRIGWSWYAEHRAGAPRTLMTIAGIGVVAVALVLVAPDVPALLWLGAAALGGSAGSWNSVGMFAIIDRLPQQAAGAASGIVMFGFLVGLGVGAPAFGWSVDRTGSYVVGLAATLVVHTVGFAMAATLRHAASDDQLRPS